MSFTTRVLIWLALACEVAGGCSMRAYQLVLVQPSLVVSVKHLGKPLSGVSVRVTKKGADAPAVIAVSTDDDGLARIDSLLPGQYDLIAEYRGIEAGREWIAVNPKSKKAKARLDFQWADYSEQMKRIAGKLTGVQKGNTGKPLFDLLHPREVPEVGVEISLEDPISQARYNAVSDDRGEFGFDALPDGTYILTIAGGAESISGTIADRTTFVIDLKASATQDELTLQLRDGGCGGAAYELQNRK